MAHSSSSYNNNSSMVKPYFRSNRNEKLFRFLF
ncbi:unnamed protein product, partial [Rotaria magnacalcarata]